MDNPITVNPYSLASYYVEPCFDNVKLSNATCFFTRQNKKLYLVTNWHVVSGKDADTLELLDKKHAAIPNKLRVYLPQRSVGDQVQFEDNDYVEIPLYDEDGFRLWYEKSQNGRMIDVVMIPVEEDGNHLYMPIEDAEDPFNKDTKIEIASEIYIIGFPFGRLGGLIPIWKRASVATEPELNIDEMPYIFADTATREGMSGSPVIFYKERGITILDEAAGQASRYKTKFIGVYSGRIGVNGDTLNNAQLGRVWKSHILEELIN